MWRVRRRLNGIKGWGFLSPASMFVFVYLFAVVIISGANGLFHVDVQTVNRPIPGQPVNLEIVVEPPFSMLTPVFGDTGNEDVSRGDQFSSRSTDNVVTVDPRKIDPLSPDHQQRSGGGDPRAALHNDNGRNVTSGHSLRRGIFNFQPPNQKTPHQASKPATINIQIPGKLPFNPFNLFNMDTLKSLVQSVTENFSGNKKAYPTGFEDSVTIISPDPEKPVPRAINHPATVLNLNNQNSNGIENGNVNNNNNQPPPQQQQQQQQQETLPFVRLPVDQQIHPKKPIRQQQDQNSIYSNPSSNGNNNINSNQQNANKNVYHHNNNNNQNNIHNKPNNQNANNNNIHMNNNMNNHQNNHLNNFPNNNQVHGGNKHIHFQSQIPAPPPQNPALLTEESMINKQMETLNEVLTHEMQIKDHRASTTMAPYRDNAISFPFLPDLSALSQLFNWGEQGARTLAVCNACRVGFGLFVSRARAGGNLANLMELATFGCTFFRITSPEMCKGLVSRFGPILHYMVMNRPSITAERFCGISLQSSGCTTTDPESHWRIDLSQYSVVSLNIEPVSPRKGKLEGIRNGEEGKGGTKEIELSSTIEGITPRRRNFATFDPSIPKGTKTLKVLHLTDIHVDFDYQPGAMNDCENEMCCHAEDGKGPPGKRAGFFGDYSKCDLPFHAYMDALEHIATQHPDIDMIYLTGDFVPHNIWNTSITRNAQVLVNASQYIYEFFPRAKVIPVIGNHETHPVNMFSPFGVPREFSTDWLYETAARSWAGWLPKESIHNFLHSGFYDVEIDPYFRIIVLNTNLCYGYNFWQSFEPRDPGGQLRWLARELQRSEDLGQFVHILGHVAPSEADCFTVWAQNFYEIINRYHHIIKAQFYGHTHFDEFRLYYHNFNRSQAINVQWIGSSLTPYTNLNPGYKIFTVDGARGEESTWDILDHETWIYNLTEANLNSHLPPRWFRLYKATEAFDIPDASPASMNTVVQRMSSNVTAFNVYHRLYHKATDVALAEGCDNLCRKHILCGIVTPHFGEHKMCVQLQSNIDGLILPASIFNVGGDSPLRAIATRSSTDSPIQRVLSFGRSLLRALGR